MATTDTKIVSERVEVKMNQPIINISTQNLYFSTLNPTSVSLCAKHHLDANNSLFSIIKVFQKSLPD